MTGLCKDCKHWLPASDLAVPGAHGKIGVCAQEIVNQKEAKELTDVDDLSVRFFTISKCESGLVTMEDFGCVDFEAGARNEKLLKGVEEQVQAKRQARLQ